MIEIKYLVINEEIKRQLEQIRVMVYSDDEEAKLLGLNLLPEILEKDLHLDLSRIAVGGACFKQNNPSIYSFSLKHLLDHNEKLAARLSKTDPDDLDSFWVVKAILILLMKDNAHVLVDKEDKAVFKVKHN
ncbi:MAG: hypothetical protein KBT36_17160 [Kurthia sp.]|nr:hypothetical protein [Candidatus Kurthia equi]